MHSPVHISRNGPLGRFLTVPASLLGAVLVYAQVTGLPLPLYALVYAAYLFAPASVLLLGRARRSRWVPLWGLVAAPILNSSLHCRLARLPAVRNPILDIVSTFRKVSTKPDQAQPCGTARSKAVSDDRRVPEERVLHAGLPMIARRLLPASPSSRLDRQDRAITNARPRSVSRHVGRTRRRNHDGRATRTGGFVKADRIVGGSRRHLSEGAVDRLDQRDASRRVVDARLRQGPGDDHTRPVDTEMPRLPASPPPSSMLRRGPFTLAHDREARAVDNEM